MSVKQNGRTKNILFFVTDAILIIGVILTFFFYTHYYLDLIQKQNISEIQNINESAANTSSAFFNNQQIRITSIIKYVTSGSKAMNYQEVLNYTCDSDGDENCHFEIIAPNYKGHAAVRNGEGNFVEVDYSNSNYYSLQYLILGTQSANDGILCTMEFTDSYDANRSFALYSHVTLDDGTGTFKNYMLMSVSKSSDFVNLIASDGGYDGLSSVIITANGDYVFGSSSFKSSNLFKYFLDYSGINRPTMYELMNKLGSTTSGIYYYKNSEYQDCIYVYTSVINTNWYCVTCVPLASFKNNHMNYWSTIIAAVIFIVLMVFNLGWLFSVNYNLKISVEKEREASAAKTDFLSRMSHDIRTPLNVIIGMTGLAEKEEGNPEETKKYLSDISQSGKFLLSLVNDILDLNKVESGKMEMHLEPYSLKEFKSSINAIIEPLCEDKKINFIITIDEDERKFLLDKVRINQIFFNILSNSVKFTSENGHISLKVSEHLMPSGTEANLVFIASDDGSGMSKEFQTHMFDAFSQEHKEGQPNVQGTGLGLTIVKNFVDLMDGSIAVDSKPGKGTTFTIIIPATVAKDIKGMEEEKKEAVAKLSGRRILLVEDNALNAEIAKKLLEEKGCIVECASDGKAGVEKFESSAINYYDAILMDLRMPVMGGIEATKVVRSLNKDDALTIPIIAMTANAYDIDVKNCLDSGMNAHIPKPIDPDLMYQTIAKEIAKRK